jgi:hypothetical protein
MAVAVLRCGGQTAASVSQDRGNDDDGRTSPRASNRGTSLDAGSATDASTPAEEPASHVEPLADALRRYWSVGGYIGQVLEEETFWHFSGDSDFEYVRLVSEIGSEPTVTRSPGSYSLDGRTLSFRYDYRQYRFDVATHVINRRPALLTRVYTPLDESSWRTEFLEESTLEDGTVWRRDLVSNELQFDAPIPADGEGDCQMRIVFRIEHYELQSATGMELPEDERTSVDMGEQSVSCQYAPTETGQQIRFGEEFADIVNDLPPVLGAVVRGSLTFHPDDPDVLFMGYALGRDDLPEYPFGP